ncbi:Uncharacterised protein [Bacillus freudenreichii]|nr:Uncharacterised protein [Bacillus freudenreichii]
MVRHKGGKVGKMGRILSDPKSTKKQKSKAGKVLKEHQDKKH